MIRIVTAIAALGLAGAAHAQSTGYLEYQAFALQTTSQQGFALRHYGTRTISDAQIEQLRALRDEAKALETSDGGKLSMQHRRYVNQRARAILGD